MGLADMYFLVMNHGVSFFFFPSFFIYTKPRLVSKSLHPIGRLLETLHAWNSQLVDITTR